MADTEMGGAQRAFPSTLWSMVQRAKDPSSSDYVENLDRLLRTYWKPVYAYIRQQWRRPLEDCKDLTQGFLTRLLEGDFFSKVDRERGSFRSYLKAALTNYLVDEERKSEAVKRGGRVKVLSFMPEDLADFVVDPTPDSGDAFDAAWISCVLNDGIRELRSHLQADGKEVYFEVFRLHYLKFPESGPKMTYEQLARALGVKVTDVTNYLAHARKCLRELLRSRVEDYVATGEEAEREVDFILGKTGQKSSG